MKSNSARRASTWVLKLIRLRSSHSRVAKKLSHRALSKQSPTEPMEGRPLASRQRRPKAMEGYWQAWSEWWITAAGRRWARAMSRAVRTSSVRRCAAMAQPTTRRLKASTATARYRNPAQVGMEVMSATHRRSGAGVLQSRAMRSGAAAAITDGGMKRFAPAHSH